MKNLIKSVIAVMNEVKGIEKSMTVGNGNSSYKGVPDKEVKKILGAAMAKNGLCLLPTGVKPTIKIERWEETDSYGRTKTKQTVFTEVTTTYLLMHESGESQEICGYGHGVDAQDKGAGKATTYALKYALLYSFLIPTGDIDDTDAVHSQDVPVRQDSMNIASWKSGINACETVEALNALYKEKASIINNNAEVLALFAERKQTLLNN
jgi:hypothetical protein